MGEGERGSKEESRKEKGKVGEGGDREAFGRVGEEGVVSPLLLFGGVIDTWGMGSKKRGGKEMREDLAVAHEK